MTKILAIETSSHRGSVALAWNDEILQYEIKSLKHSLEILSTIDKLLLKANVQKESLTAISFGQGPGSFTGIRLAAAVAQSSAFALNIPVIPVSSLQALAQRAWHEHQCTLVLVALDARFNQVYWGSYERDKKTNIMMLQGAEKLESPQAIQWPTRLPNTWKGIGNAYESYRPFLKGEWIDESYPNAYNIATIALHDYQKGRTFSALNVQPSYLLDQVVQVPSSK